MPVSFALDDVVEKVEYLRANDHLARRIATNGKAFADSYLRLEDHFCYVAAALNTLGRALKGSEILEPYDPVRVDKDSQQFGDFFFNEFDE